MGFSVKFNWVLQIEPPEALQVNDTHTFKKPDSRVFPLDTPIDLIDLKRNAIAKIRIKSFSTAPVSTDTSGGAAASAPDSTRAETTGVFEVIKIYLGKEQEILTNYWIENE